MEGNERRLLDFWDSTRRKQADSAMWLQTCITFKKKEDDPEGRAMGTEARAMGPDAEAQAMGAEACRVRHRR